MEGPISTPLFNLSDTQCLLPSVCQTPFTRAVFTGSMSAPGMPETFSGREGGGAVGEEGFSSMSIFLFKSSRTSDSDRSNGLQAGGASQGFNTVIAGPGKGAGKLTDTSMVQIPFSIFSEISTRVALFSI